MGMQAGSQQQHAFLPFALWHNIQKQFHMLSFMQCVGLSICAYSCALSQLALHSKLCPLAQYFATCCLMSTAAVCKHASRITVLSHTCSTTACLCSGVYETLLTSSNSEEEAELEYSFQHALEQDAEAVSRAPVASLLLDAAVQHLDIDNLLKKLVCGDLEFDSQVTNR